MLSSGSLENNLFTDLFQLKEADYVLLLMIPLLHYSNLCLVIPFPAADSDPLGSLTSILVMILTVSIIQGNLSMQRPLT